MLGWPIQIKGTVWNILRSRLIKVHISTLALTLLCLVCGNLWTERLATCKIQIRFNSRFRVGNLDKKREVTYVVCYHNTDKCVIDSFGGCNFAVCLAWAKDIPSDGKICKLCWLGLFFFTWVGRTWVMELSNHSQLSAWWINIGSQPGVGYSPETHAVTHISEDVYGE